MKKLLFIFMLFGARICAMSENKQNEQIKRRIKSKLIQLYYGSNDNSNDNLFVFMDLYLFVTMQEKVPEKSEAILRKKGLLNENNGLDPLVKEAVIEYVKEEDHKKTLLSSLGIE